MKKNYLARKTTTYDIRNPGPDLGQAQKCGKVTTQKNKKAMLKILVISYKKLQYYNTCI